MTRTLLTLSLYLLWSFGNPSSAQETFSRTYSDLDPSLRLFGQELYADDSGTYFLARAWNRNISPARHQSRIVTVDPAGNVVRDVLLADDQGVLLFQTHAGTARRGDSLYLPAEYFIEAEEEIRQVAIVAYSTVDGGLNVRRYPDSEENVVVVRGLNVIAATGELQLLTLAADRNYAFRSTRLRVFDGSGAVTVDRQLEDSENFEVLGIMDVRFLDNGDFLLSAVTCRQRSRGDCDFIRYPHRLFRYSARGTLIWSQRYREVNAFEGTDPLVTELPGGSIGLSSGADSMVLGSTQWFPIVHLLDSLGNVGDSIAFRGIRRRIERLRPAANGDLLVVGHAEPPSGSVGWVARISPRAELRWERFVSEESNVENNFAAFTDIRSTPGGGLQLLGFRKVRLDSADMVAPWLVQLTADGCYAPGCTGDTIRITEEPDAVTYAPEAAGLSVFPNPVHATTQLTLPDVYAGQSLSYQLLTLDGRELRLQPFVGPAATVPFRELPTGTYLLRVFGEGGTWLAARKVVKW